MIIESERVIACRSQIEALWPLLTDTERLNRAVGMEKVTYRPNNDGSAARFVGSTHLGGFDVEYDERPSEWVYHRHFRISRAMRSGPIAQLETLFRFEPMPQGSTVSIKLSFTPKVALMAPIVRLRARQSLDRFEREIQRIDAALAAGDGRPSLGAATHVNAEALEQAGRELRARDGGPLGERLLQLVREGDDLDLSRMRPFSLADAWGESRTAVLSAMLHAVRAGLLEMRWELVCPSCRVATDTVPALSSLKDHGACQMCELDFGLDVDEALEVSFSPSRAVRKVEHGPFCIGGPARVPHVVAQAILPPHGSTALQAPLEPGRYRLFVRGGLSAQLAVAPGAPAQIEAALGGEPVAQGQGGRAGSSGPLGSLPSPAAASAADAPTLSVAPGGAVVVANPTAEERHAKIERSSWSSQAATAREVTALAAFRRDFSSDVLKPGASLRVSRVSLFFSDLTGSTQLYSNVGDAVAFRLVQDHFDVVISSIERHGGALVKTIGDAVMAVFADDLDGVQASLDILQAFEVFRRGHPSRLQTHIKLGLYGGPCYVVTANGLLDYFGQTVNIAARLQAQAESGELVVSDELADRAVARGLAPAAWVRERYEARLKGVDSPIRVARVTGAGGLQPLPDATRITQQHRPPRHDPTRPDANERPIRNDFGLGSHSKQAPTQG
jgi:adenylate cyclase